MYNPQTGVVPLQNGICLADKWGLLTILKEGHLYWASFCSLSRGILRRNFLQQASWSLFLLGSGSVCRNMRLYTPLGTNNTCLIKLQDIIYIFHIFHKDFWIMSSITSLMIHLSSFWQHVPQKWCLEYDPSSVWVLVICMGYPATRLPLANLAGTTDYFQRCLLRCPACTQ